MAGGVIGMLRILRWVDITTRRLIEIGAHFLYRDLIVINYGFKLLIFAMLSLTGSGISYYMRAEMLRLRRQPFVRGGGAWVAGWKIALRHSTQ